jgi:hypothetical protein
MLKNLESTHSKGIIQLKLRMDNQLLVVHQITDWVFGRCRCNYSGMRMTLEILVSNKYPSKINLTFYLGTQLIVPKVVAFP